MGLQSSLFGEPPLQPSLSQWHTPPWLARKVAQWVPRGARVLEPSCGGGALIDGLLRAKHQPVSIHAMEIDPAWCEVAHDRFPGVEVVCGDFLTCALAADAFDAVVMNPPFEGDAHLRFVLRALELAPVVVAVVPASFEFGQARDEALWRTRGVVTRRARCPARVDYGGDQSGKFDTVALKVERRAGARFPGELMTVREEVWAP